MIQVYSKTIKRSGPDEFTSDIEEILTRSAFTFETRIIDKLWGNRAISRDGLIER